MKLFSANVISQAIALVVYPLVTRLYSPEEFGAFNVFMSICSVFFVLSTGKYDGAVILPKSHRDAAAVFHLCMLIASTVFLFLGCIVILFKTQVLGLFHIESIGNGIYFLPFLVFFYGFGYTLCRWFNRLKKYELISRYEIVQNSVNSSGKVLFGLLGLTRLGLVYALFLGNLFSALSILFIKNKKRVFCLLTGYRKERIRKVAATYANYPKYTLPHSFIDMLSGNLPLLLLTPYFEKNVIGFFSLAMVIGFRPVNLITSSMNQVFFQRSAELYNKKAPVLPLFRQFFRKIFLFFFPVFILLFFVVTPLTTYVFGAEWTEAAKSLKILMPWFFLTLFTGTFSFLPVIFFKQKQAMIIEFIHTVCRLIAIFIGIYTHNFYSAIIAFSIVSSIFVSMQFVWYYLLILRYEKKRSSGVSP